MDPRRLRSTLDDHPDTAHLLAVFEFDVSRGAQGNEFELSSGETLHTVAGTFASDTYLVCGSPHDDRPVAYATSEGQAGLIARNSRRSGSTSSRSCRSTTRTPRPLTRLHDAVSSTWPDHVISDEDGEY